MKTRFYIAFNILLLFCVPVFADNTPFPPADIKADRIIVEKSARRMTLYSNGSSIRSYKVALGKRPEGPKLVKGDMKTPEGTYVIDSRNSDSRYHLALQISYPNEIDQELAFMAGVQSGGSIMIHGTGEEYEWMGKFHAVKDWTDGCIAVTNEEIEEIWDLVPDGVKIIIRP